MTEAIKVLDVTKVGDNLVLVTFSDGRIAQYSAAQLSSMSGVSRRPVSFRDRFWTGDSD